MAKGFLDGYKTYDTTNGHGNAKQWRQSFKERMSNEQAETIIKAQADTPLGILGLAAGATQAEIKKAFRKLIIEWHPDRNQHRQEEAEEQSKKIIAAYSILTN